MIKKNKIKYLFMDVDGTLTNGQINIGNDGEVFKSFYCRDGLGILRANQKGITSIIITSRKSEIVEQRARELNIEHVFQGLNEKKIDQMKKIVQQFNIEKGEIAYIGDDINDLECMQISDIVGCPQDSVDEVKKVATYICKHKGGEGAVREFIDWILE